MQLKPVLIPEETHFKLRKHATALRLKLKDAATQAIEAWVERMERKGKR